MSGPRLRRIVCSRKGPVKWWMLLATHSLQSLHALSRCWQKTWRCFEIILFSHRGNKDSVSAINSVLSPTSLSFLFPILFLYLWFAKLRLMSWMSSIFLLPKERVIRAFRTIRFINLFKFIQSSKTVLCCNLADVIRQLNFGLAYKCLGKEWFSTSKWTFFLCSSRSFLCSP